MRTYEGLPGNHIEEVARTAIALAGEHGERVRFKFNDQEITVTRSDDAKAVADAYMAECDRLHKEWLASPAGQQAQRESEAANARAAAAEAEGILPFTLLDGTEAEWAAFVEKNTQDGYSACTVRYAARWANLMERRMAEGHTIHDCADKASHEADVEGITGFMYGCAVGAIAKFWKHGEELRRWHNLKTQIGSEGEKANESGGVLNPAVMTIG